jgi:hypothetical protein
MGGAIGILDADLLKFGRPLRMELLELPNPVRGAIARHVVKWSAGGRLRKRECWTLGSTYFTLGTFARLDAARRLAEDSELRSRYASFLRAAREPSLL